MFNTGEAVILSEVMGLRSQGKSHQATAKMTAWNIYVTAMQVARYDADSKRSNIALDEYTAACEQAVLDHPND